MSEIPPLSYFGLLRGFWGSNDPQTVENPFTRRASLARTPPTTPMRVDSAFLWKAPSDRNEASKPSSISKREQMEQSKRNYSLDSGPGQKRKTFDSSLTDEEGRADAKEDPKACAIIDAVRNNKELERVIAENMNTKRHCQETTHVYRDLKQNTKEEMAPGPETKEETDLEERSQHANKCMEQD